MSSFVISIKSNIKGIAFIIAASVCVAFGQIMWKLSGGNINSDLITGFFLYGIGSLLMVTSFKYGSFSALHPMLSFGYVISLILGHFVLQEFINMEKVIGVLFLVIGVICIGGGDRR